MPISLLNLLPEALGNFSLAPWHDHTGYFSCLLGFLHLLDWIYLDFYIHTLSNGLYPSFFSM